MTEQTLLQGKKIYDKLKYLRQDLSAWAYHNKIEIVSKVSLIYDDVKLNLSSEAKMSIVNMIIEDYKNTIDELEQELEKL